MDITKVHSPLPFAYRLSLWYTTVFYWPTGGSMEHYCLLLTHWISQRYTVLSFWHTGYLYGTLLSSTGPLDIAKVHYPSYWPNEYLYGTLPSPIDPLAITMVHYYLLLDHLISLCYTTLTYWPTCYPYDTLSYSTGLLYISLVHYPLLLAH